MVKEEAVTLLQTGVGTVPLACLGGFGGRDEVCSDANGRGTGGNLNEGMEGDAGEVLTACLVLYSKRLRREV